MKSYGIKRNCCPACGGKIKISVLFQYSLNYSILKNGRISKSCKKQDNGSIGVSLAGCENCNTCWEEDDFYINDGQFIDLKYGEI